MKPQRIICAVKGNSKWWLVQFRAEWTRRTETSNCIVEGWQCLSYRSRWFYLCLRCRWSASVSQRCGYYESLEVVVSCVSNRVAHLESLGLKSAEQMCSSSLCSLWFVLVVIGCECTLSVFPPRLKLKRWSSHLENPFRFWIEVFSKWLEIGMACRFWNRPWRCRLSRFWPWWRRPHRSSWSSSWPCWRRVCTSRSPRCASRFWRRRVRHYY